jgi:hypothetical protein
LQSETRSALTVNGQISNMPDHKGAGARKDASGATNKQSPDDS